MEPKLFEIKLPKPDNFLKVKETLTRIGVASKQHLKLYQSCHILHKKGKYYIVHFKEMFMLDGKASDITEADYARRNAIIGLLVDWNLVEMPEGVEKPRPVCPISALKIINFRDKHNWELVPKYEIGA